MQTRLLRARTSALAGLALGATLVLPGCTSVPILWPLSEPPPPQPDYPSGRLSAGQSCTANGMSAVLPASDTDRLYCEQIYAAALAAKLAGEQRVLEAAQNGGTLALFGLGTAAGVEGVVTHAAIPLRNLGLAAAGVAGFSSSLGLAGQRAAYQAAATALACTIRIDAALDSASAAIALPGAAAAPEPADTASADAALMQTLVAGMASPGDRPASLVTAAGITSLVSGMLASEALQTADASLLAATTQAAGAPTRTQNLTIAITHVLGILSDSLYKTVDISKLYSQAKADYATQAGAVPAGNAAVHQAVTKAAGHDTGAVMAAQETLKTSPAAVKLGAHAAAMMAAAPKMMTATMNSATAHMAATQNVAQAVTDCTADSPTTPGTPVPPATTK